MTSGRISLAALAMALAVGTSLAGSAAASEPLAFWDGRLRVGGEVSGTYGSDDLGFFNYTDYETSMLRLFRVDLAAEVRLASAAALVGEIRSDNVSSLRVYALYLRLRPWAGRAFDLQAGLIPPVFGAYPRRRYALDNPLPSVPLAYQYLLALRDDAVPANADQLVAQRGRGWQVRYPVGSTAPAPGFPLVNGQKWDAGVEAQWASSHSRSRWPSPRGRCATPWFATTTPASRCPRASPGRTPPTSPWACRRRSASSSRAK